MNTLYFNSAAASNASTMFLADQTFYAILNTNVQLLTDIFDHYDVPKTEYAAAAQQLIMGCAIGGYLMSPKKLDIVKGLLMRVMDGKKDTIIEKADRTTIRNISDQILDELDNCGLSFHDTLVIVSQLLRTLRARKSRDYSAIITSAKITKDYEAGDRPTK